MNTNKLQRDNFPLGSAINIDQLERDPYPTYAKLREFEPVSFVPALNMYMVTRYDDVREILQDTETFIVGTESSTVYDTFGEHMMTVEGATHDCFKSAHQPFFTPVAIRDLLEDRIKEHANRLIDGFPEGQVELRNAFASRLPILTMLSLFGMDAGEEPKLRAWYDSFEAALSNFTWDEGIRAKGKRNAGQFIQLVQSYIDRLRGSQSNNADSDATLLSTLAGAPKDQRLSDEQICHNALIVFFGGISTVEALILNTLYALSLNPAALERVRENRGLMQSVLNETVRWLGPVQSATRHVTSNVTFRGVDLHKGDTVNCILASANHDAAIFDEPDVFDIARPNANRHIGFAVGPHHCLGSRLARAEARIAVEQLLSRLPDFHLVLDKVDGPVGFEFRQPKSAIAAWDIKGMTNGRVST